MNVHQFLTSYSYGDAIGNEALQIRNYLRGRGIESEIFALFYHPRYAGQIINHREYGKYADSDNVAVFHFSIGSPVTKTFLRLPDRKVMIYHNITPHHFFLDYHRVLAKDCFKGRVELKNLVGKVDLALGDSEFNEAELKELGFSPTGVLPLVMDFEKFSRPVVPVIRDLFSDGRTNILYVGRIIPNKRIEEIIRVFHLYQRFFNPDSRLLLVGEYRGFERYLSALQKMVARFNNPHIFFTGHVPEDELISYFRMAHLYLHMSEHEGFCAPVPESFHLDIPVVAFDAGAVAETMGGGGLLVHRKAPLEIAALCDRVLRDESLRQRVLESQRRVVQNFRIERTGAILLRHLGELTGKDFAAGTRNSAGK
ncbi:MAG: glycosyltransferase family 4 protein [Acidobacteriota bacterium]|jgi:glycosyltransferase involved in cell wall biosynthesis|nr:glycosyltransferase family 4 protein [Acidobacteriota bacterium]